MPNSVLEAIRAGIWDFEPEHMAEEAYSATKALPGSYEKVDVLAKRAQLGLPLWHPCDRRTVDDAGLGED